MTVEVKARLTLDTADFQKGASQTDQAADQLQKRTDARAAAAEAQAAARAQAQADREARRLADREAKEQAAQARATARAQKTAEREARQIADQEAREQAAVKRREERAQQEAERAAARASRQASQAQEAARREEEKEKSRTAQRASQLQFQLNDIFTGLTTGQNPLTVALQQGPQITQLYGGFTNMMAGIPKVALAAVAAIGLVGGAMAAGISSAAESASRQRQFAIELQATGNAASYTAARLEELVKAEARRGGVDRTGAATAVSTFAGNYLLDNEQVLQRVLGVSVDLARVQGRDLPAAAEDFNRSLDGTSAGARRLDQAYNLLTASELEQIRVLEDQGRKREVVNIVLEATERRFKGLNEQGLSPTTKAIKELGNAWTDFVDKVGNSKVAQGAMWTGAQILKGATMLINGAPPLPGQNDGLTQADVQQQRDELKRAREAQARLRSSVEGATDPMVRGFAQAELNKAEARVKELEANVAYLERSVTSAQVSATAATAATAANEAAETQRRAKEQQDRLDALNTVAKRRRELQAEQAQLQAGVAQGLFPPETLKQAQERLVQIRGEMATLGTASEKLQKDLDLESKLAKLPAHLQAGERAFQQMYRQALEAGDTEAQARAKADQARSNALASQSVATQQQIEQLGAEAQAALKVADAYGTSRVAALRAAAQAAAEIAEQQGQIAPGTAGQVAAETLEKNAAATVQAAAEKNRAYGEEVEALGRLASAEARGSEAAREAERANRVAALAVELRAQAEASGSAAIVAAAEEQIRKYDELSRKQLQVDRTRAANQLNAQFDPQVAYQQQMADLQALQETGVLTARTVADATRQYEQQRLEASRSATDGMVAGLRRYAEEAANSGRAAADSIASGMRTAEDALVQFVTTGKFNFSSLTNSILADLARIAVRKTITGPLSDALGSVFSGAGDWFGGILGGASAGVGTGTGWTYHRGGVVGEGGVNVGPVPLSTWDGAQRYHEGGKILKPGEVPIIAMAGEEVLTRNDPRHRDNGYGRSAAPSVQVNVYTAGNEKVTTEQGIGADGMPRLDVIIGEVEQAIAGRFSKTHGPLWKAVSATLGARQVART